MFSLYIQTLRTFLSGFIGTEVFFIDIATAWIQVELYVLGTSHLAFITLIFTTKLHVNIAKL